MRLIQWLPMVIAAPTTLSGVLPGGIFLVGKEVGELAPPAVTAPVWAWQVQGLIHRLPTQDQADDKYHRAGEHTQGTFRLMLSP